MSKDLANRLEKFSQFICLDYISGDLTIIGKIQLLIENDELELNIYRIAQQLEDEEIDKFICYAVLCC
jgi:hypothetical protein